MKKKQVPGLIRRNIDRIVNIIWAFALLAPLIVIAGKTEDSRPLFHAVLFIAGWFCWSYTEYFLHRFVMHESDQKKGIGKLLNHTHHHTEPDDIRVKGPHRLLMITGCTVFVVAAIWADNYFTLAFGYVAGFTAYSLMHFILHQPWSATVFTGLHQFHIHHHCKHPDKCFGVITTWWDYLFNTIPVTETEITARIKQFYYKKNAEKKKERFISPQKK